MCKQASMAVSAYLSITGNSDVSFRIQMSTHFGVNIQDQTVWQFKITKLKYMGELQQIHSYLIKNPKKLVVLQLVNNCCIYLV